MTETEAVESTQDGSTSVGAAGCAGGPACSDTELCVTTDEICECEPGFEHCMLVARTPGCVAAVPFDCMEVEDTEACLLSIVCGYDSGNIEDGVITCNVPMDCAGSCDSVEGCQTAGGDASATDGGSTSE